LSRSPVSKAVGAASQLQQTPEIAVGNVSNAIAIASFGAEIITGVQAGVITLTFPHNGPDLLSNDRPKQRNLLK